MSRIIHFEIQASDPQVLMDFYSAILGWRFNKWGPIDYWLIETGSADELGINGGLMPRQSAAPLDLQAVNAFVCTSDVVDLDKSLASALKLGATVALPKQPVMGVGWLAYIKDPDGNILGLMQTDTEAK